MAQSQSDPEIRADQAGQDFGTRLERLEAHFQLGLRTVRRPDECLAWSLGLAQKVQGVVSAARQNGGTDAARQREAVELMEQIVATLRSFDVGSRHIILEGRCQVILTCQAELNDGRR